MTKIAVSQIKRISNCIYVPPGRYFVLLVANKSTEFGEVFFSPKSGTICVMTILPEGEKLRKAIKWVSDERIANPEAKLFSLIGEACLKFDLPPKDEEFLIQFLADKGSETTD